MREAGAQAVPEIRVGDVTWLGNVTWLGKVRAVETIGARTWRILPHSRIMAGRPTQYVTPRD
jgi:hypothetical protein